MLCCVDAVTVASLGDWNVMTMRRKRLCFYLLFGLKDVAFTGRRVVGRVVGVGALPHKV
jgi:hypothetical protein